MHRMKESSNNSRNEKYLFVKENTQYIYQERERIRETGEDKYDITKTKENNEEHMEEREKRDKIVMTISRLQRIRGTGRRNDLLGYHAKQRMIERKCVSSNRGIYWNASHPDLTVIDSAHISIQIHREFERYLVYVTLMEIMDLYRTVFYSKELSVNNSQMNW